MTQKAEDQPKKTKKKKPKSFARKVSAFLVPLVIFALLGVGMAGHWVSEQFNTVSIVEEDKTLVIPPGSGVIQIANLLESEGIIDNAVIFKVALRVLGLEKGLKAGEFLFPAGTTPYDAAEILREGKSIQHRITFAEGLTSSEMVEVLNAEPKLETLILQIPPEGSLLPETYSFTRGMSRARLLTQMQRAMERTLDELWETRAQNLPLQTKQEALILASIIEKETALDHERGIVAGVFVNRLRKNMRLQTDPTVIYGITLGKEPLGRPLRRSDLREKTDYNTYVIKGLPPTPIANPGRASIEAALNPEKTDAIYFVADGTGGHAFARTLKEHNRNVAKWRRIQREK